MAFPPTARWGRDVGGAKGWWHFCDVRPESLVRTTSVPMSLAPHIWSSELLCLQSVLTDPQSHEVAWRGVAGLGLAWVWLGGLDWLGLRSKQREDRLVGLGEPGEWVWLAGWLAGAGWAGATGGRGVGLGLA